MPIYDGRTPHTIDNFHRRLPLWTDEVPINSIVASLHTIRCDTERSAPRDKPANIKFCLKQVVILAIYNGDVPHQVSSGSPLYSFHG